jgi:hypothetical protein
LIGTLQPSDLEKAVTLLPAGVYKSRETQGPVLQADSDQVPAAGAVKDGGLANHNGQIVVRRGSVFEPAGGTSFGCREDSRNAPGA